MFALTLDGKSVYPVFVTTIESIFFMVPMHIENHQLVIQDPVLLWGPQHQTGTVETSSLMD